MKKKLIQFHVTSAYSFNFYRNSFNKRPHVYLFSKILSAALIKGQQLKEEETCMSKKKDVLI